ncbi:MAG: hypothetical protein QM628_05910 [Propionicimonas sp.]
MTVLAGEAVKREEGTGWPGASRGVLRLGAWSAGGSAFFYVAFDVVAILELSGVLSSPFWRSVLSYAPSIFLALTFLAMAAVIHGVSRPESRVWTHVGVCLACMYATINCFIYIIQVLIVAPSMLNGGFEAVALFEMAPGKPLIAANALAYTLMGLSTLFLAAAFKGGGRLEKVTRGVLLAHGVISPTVVGVLLWPPLLSISAFVGILYPWAAIMIAVLFRNAHRRMAGIAGAQ